MICAEVGRFKKQENKMTFSDYLSLLGGVAFFLFGMNTMGGGLKQLAGNKMEAVLWKLSSTPFKGFLLGTLVAAAIQSSGATTVMVISFVSTGMMTFSQSVGIVLGANVGTTMTGWILSISNANSGSFTTVLISLLALAGCAMVLFSHKNTYRAIGNVALGLATLLLAMSLISDSVSPLKESPRFANLLILFRNPLFGILAGALITAVTQSSSASVGILQALSVSGAIPYSVCLPIIIGINIGAATPVLIAMLGANRNGKRTAVSYLVINVIAFIATYIVYIPANLIFDMSFMNGPANVLGIAIMNTVLRLIMVAFVLPALKQVEKLCYMIVKPDPAEREDMYEIDSLDDSLLNYAPTALELSKNATMRMCDIATKNVYRALRLLTEFDRTKYQKVITKEELCDKYEDKLGNYIVKIGKNGLNDKQQAISRELLSAVGDFERLSDHAQNIAETANEINEKKIALTDDVLSEIKLMVEATKEIIGLSRTAFIERRRDLALKVEPLEETIDEMTKQLRANHINRVSSNTSTILTGFVYSDLLINIERVADHCSNIAFSVVHSYDINAEEHKYTAQAADSPDFRDELSQYLEKYVEPITPKQEQ